ncbi:MAG: Dyp-type peroxidase, partial [Catenulispora sp.]
MRRPDPRPSRRRFLGAAGAVVAASGAAGCDAPSAKPAKPIPAAADTPVSPTGRYQAGVTIPQPAQTNLLAVVADLDGSAAPGPLLAELGRTVLALTAGTDPRLLGLAPGDLTITIGVGPRLVRETGAGRPGAADLPPFSRERIPAPARGGDLLIQLCAADALVLPVAAAALLDQAGARVTERWRQSGRRGPNTTVAAGRTAPRNLLGFIDGIVGPATPADQERHL